MLAPLSTPRNFIVSRTNESSTLLLSWISPLESDLNGVLCRYVVRYSPVNVNSSNAKGPEFIEAGAHETRLRGLEPYTEYDVKIAAETCSVDRKGPFASAKNRTGEGGLSYICYSCNYPILFFLVPNKPNIRLIEKNSTWVKLEWRVEPNGILFRVEANISSDQGYVYNTSKKSGEAEFFDLEPHHSYTVRIRAYSGRGAGAFGTINVSTCAAGIRTHACSHATIVYVV